MNPLALVESVNSDNSGEEDEEAHVPGFSVVQHQEIVPHSSRPSDADAAGFLHEIADIIQWVKTGKKRKEDCVKTLMEKRFDEMEQALKENTIKLNQAQLEICVLKQINAALKTENTTLKIEVEKEKKEKDALLGRLIEIQDPFHPLQVKYFSDSPYPNDDQSYLEDNQQQANNDCSNIQPMVQLKKEIESEDELEEIMFPEVPEEYVPIQVEASAGTLQVSAPSTENQLVVHPGTSQPAAVRHADKVNCGGQQRKRNGNQLAAAPLSSRVPTNHQRQRIPRNEKIAELKQHGIDVSKKRQGAFCLCGIKCTTNRTLSSHIVYFTCEKRFECHVCHKRFVGTNYLKGHMKRSHKIVYTGGSNGCRDCGKTFDTLSQLRQHKKEDHYQTGISNASCSQLKATNPIISTKHRRSLRMRHKQLTNGKVNSTLKMLKGSCSNCGFCREHQNKSESKQHQNSRVAVGNHVARHTSSKRKGRVYRSSSSESDSFCCDFCQKWFGDDQRGLLKHQQNCFKT